MNDPLVAVTVKYALLFGVPALVLAVFCHIYLPLRTWTVVAVLLAAELALFEFDFTYESTDTALGMLVVPGVALGLLIGNLLAIPIARGLRSLFNSRAKR